MCPINVPRGAPVHMRVRACICACVCVCVCACVCVLLLLLLWDRTEVLSPPSERLGKAAASAVCPVDCSTERAINMTSIETGRNRLQTEPQQGEF